MDGSQTWLDDLKDYSGTFQTVSGDLASIAADWTKSPDYAGAPMQTPQQRILIAHQAAVGAAQGQNTGSVGAASQWSLGSLGLGAGNNTLLLLLAGGLVLFLVLKK